ncbi:hypothetical protein NHX12_032760 [Muraenolepis orangiensis]|uniref:Receptor-type tyrosine-protein phosphatase C n=1 Tax=Muraenolepis orangiensis TaxID=630683 RepID=A0A9Q0IIZ9_9TELE|nr:hypothetical protein NHX12_032760 [Muraenolepis orangiensis]
MKAGFEEPAPQEAVSTVDKTPRRQKTRRPFNLTLKHVRLTLEHGHLTLKYVRLTLKQVRLTLEQGRLTLKYVRLTLKHVRLNLEHGRLTLKHVRLNLEHGRLTLEHGRLTLEHGRLNLEQGRLTLKHGRLTLKHGRLTLKHGRLNLEHGRLTLKHGRLTLEHGRLTLKHSTALCVPSDLEKLTVTLKGNNVVSVTCPRVVSWNGNHGVYIANNDKALIGFLVFLILLTSVALAFVLYKIYILHRRKSHQDEDDEDQLMRVEPIRAELLLDAYKKKVADEGRLFLAEFQSIPRIFSRNTMKEAKRSHNAVKNRYVDILPYDYNRVQLTTGNGETGCDYINASFINGFRESKKMVWEQKSSIIVMVTRCEEGSRAKCAQYWPSAVPETEVFEEFVVKLCKEEQCPDYIIRCLTVSNKGENLEREVTQIQFISWPDHGVPEEPQLLLKLRKRVNTFKNLFSGPIVVHCSAGVGRTGTYIGIDAMMEGLESEGQVDIYGYIVNLRKQRCLMVQVETQYILIHQAMIEHNQFGETEISLSEFHSALSMLAGEPNLLQEEFKRLPKYNNWRTCNTGLTEENKKKNRFSAVIPYDYNRVLVKLDEDLSHNANLEDEDESSSEEEEDEDSMKYINASHIDGYWGPGGLVTAQSPLANTAGDFWLMVYQKRATAVVMMSDCTQGATELCSPYWDENKKAFLDVEVEVIETESTPAVTIRTMNIYHTKRKESRRVKQFHFLQWPSQQLPENSIQLMEMIRTIKQTCGYGNGPLEGQGPVVVHCSNGSYCSGVFCALWNLLDAGHTERTVDVFQAAKALRKQRQGMISSLEQYRFLYEAVAAAFPVQNGDVTSAVAAAAAAADDSVIIVNETGHILEDPAGSSATGDQQVAVAASEAAASIPLLERSTKEEEQDEATKTTAVDAASNGSTVTMEV